MNPPTTTARPRGIGLLGLGVMGRRMAQALQAHEGFRIVAGFDPAAPADVPGVPRLDSAEAVATHPGVECVYIATPPALHRAHVALVTAAGKAVFCEKPLAASVDEAEACCEAIRAAGVAAGVNFPFSTSAGARQLQQLITAGELGTVQGARLTLRFARWPRPWQMDAAGWLAGPQQGGFTREVGSHFLFLAGRLFGPGVIEQVSLRRGAAGTEEALAATLRYGALPLQIDAQVAGTVDDHNRFEVVGSAGSAALTEWQRLEWRGALPERSQGRAVAQPAPLGGQGTRERPLIPGARRDGLPGQLDALAQLLAREADHGLATPEEAAAVVRLVEGVLAAG